MDIWTLRNAVTNDEIDSLALKYLLKDYKRPRDKITKLLKSGQLIQVKRGLYVFGQKYRKRLYNLYTLANQIYGPSAISLEFALAYYGLIPERVDTITSITPKKDKAYNTPVGRFTYRYCHPHKYNVGLTLIEIDETHHAIIATPEKALCDVIAFGARSVNLSNAKQAEEYLIEDLRFDEEGMNRINSYNLRKINDRYRSKSIERLIQYIESRNE